MSFSVCHCFSSSQSAYYFLNGQLQYLQQHNHRVSLAVPNDGFIDELRIMFPSVNIFIIPIVRNINLIKDSKALFAYVRLFKQQNFTIIHLHTPKAGLLGSIAGRLLLHAHIVFHLHGFVSLQFNKLKPNFTFFMEKIPLFLSHKVLCVSESLRQLCIDNRLISPEKIVVLHHGSINGIECFTRFNPYNFKDKIIELKTKLEIKDKFVIGFLGRMNEDKGFQDIIKVSNLLSENISNLTTIFVGPNEMESDINEYLTENLTGNFEYHSRTTQPELFISTFDVMLFPSYREGFGLVAAEANALEIPVVAYKIIGIQDSVVDNETGILVRPGDINALVNAILFYEQNPKVRKQHGINGRNRVINHFKPEDIWAAQLNFYKELLND